MKDPVFTGKDVTEAVHMASRTLGVAESALRYVVLDPGQPGGRGLSPTEARIAVLIERVASGGRSGSPVADVVAEAVDWDAGRGRGARRGRPREAARADAPVDDPEAAVRTVVREIARAAGVELTVDVSDGRDGVEVRLDGPGTRIFFEPNGEALSALEHVVERLFGRGLAGGRRVRLRCAGYRDYRDEQLREQALALARQVCADGQARTTPPLNAYERRVVHVTLEGRDGVTTFSVGEGHARRVTVAVKGTVGDVDLPDGSTPAEAAAAGAAPEGAPATEGEAPHPPHPPEPQHATVSFDARRFDRPPQGGGASELM